MDFDSITIGKKYSRKELAYLWGYQSYHALSRGVFTPVDEDLIILFVTRKKQSSSTPYEDFIEGDRLYWEGEKGHKNDLRIAENNGSNPIYLFYREIHHTPFEFKGKVNLLKFSLHEDKPSQFVFQLTNELNATNDIKDHQENLVGLNETDRTAIVTARTGQGTFRERLLEKWKGCAITGIYIPDLLRASHIKPWRESSNTERLDPNNGLLLLPTYDALFDKGFISFDEEGKIMISHAIGNANLNALGIHPGIRLQINNSEMQSYLDYHRKNIYITILKEGEDQ